MRLLPKSGAHRRRRLATLPALPRPGRVPSSRPRVRARSWPGRHGAPKARSVERRRARALVLVALVFAAVVLASALPWSTLVNQHTQLTSASAQVSALEAENQSLAAEARGLSDQSTQAGLARQDYGLVEPGQKAYEILPAAGTTASDDTTAGHVPLDEGPVVPGSRQSEELLGAGAVSATPARSSTAGGSVPTTTKTAVKASGNGDSLGARGFWSRVAHSLEFWS